VDRASWIVYLRDVHPSVTSGPGAVAELGAIARNLGLRHPLLVSDRGMLATGYVDTARRLLIDAGLTVDVFHDFSQNPTSDMIEAGRVVAAGLGIDSLIGLGGGSSMDCAKGINFVLTNGGTMADYRGYGKAARPLLPMIAVPTTAGTGSEAQSYALISDPRTHEKMACGDPKAAFTAAVLDPELTLSQPPHVTAATGYDAISHAVETWVTTKRNPESERFSREAWTLLSANYDRVLSHPRDLKARAAMLNGAHLAGAAIECSMLGATHACANALTAQYETVHGVAIALLLPHVVRWNAANGHGATPVAERYKDLDPNLPAVLERLAKAGGFPSGLGAAGVRRADIDTLAAEAAQQWTGTFNPRAFDARGAREIYEMAW
jgi:alcohol dehydrogenase